MKILKQNAGIDIAKDSFVASFIVVDEQQNIKCKGTRLFSNNLKGFDLFLNWCEKFQQENLEMNFTMEATGVYYESLAYYLSEKDFSISVLLPNIVKKFGESLNIKSKTDKIDSKIIGQMGAERKLPKWKISSKIYRELKTLTRERQRLVENRTAIKNQIHAEQHTAKPMKTTLTRLKNHVKYLNKQIESIEKELESKVSKDNYISKKVTRIITIPGIAFITAITIIAETQGFDNFTSMRQLSSFAGYDIRLRDSGKFVGKTKISKKGNSHIRRALYMPSLSSIQHSNTYGKFYERLVEKKRNGLIAGVAVQRKLLGLIYTLWKSDSVYIDNYVSKIAN